MPDVNFHLQRLSSLRSHRTNFDAQWEEAAARLIPAHRSTFLAQGMSSMSPGRKNTELMFDSTAALALQRFAAVMESLSMPQGQQWHRLVPGDPTLRKNRQVRKYLDEVTRRLFKFRYRPKANFIGQAQKQFLSYGAYGNGLLFVDTLVDEPGIRYKALHLGEAYVLENHQGVIDTLYRSFRLRPRDIVAQFGAEGNVPDAVKKAVKEGNKTNETFEIVHAIYPRDEYDPERRDGQGMPWASVYIFVEEQKVLQEGGYRAFPAAMSRYMQFVGETYGRGPAQMVLPSIKVLNEEKKTMLKQGHRVVDPVLLAHDDGVVGTFSMKPGAMNIGGVSAQGHRLVHELPTGNPLAGKDMMDDERAVINDAFLITLFQILVDAPSRMTATEVVERVREKGLLIAPTTGRLQAEFLGPMIEREVDLLEQQGLLPPPPQALVEAGAEWNVEYDAPMSRMARAENASGFMRSLQTALEIVSYSVDSSPLDLFDLDKAMPAILDINGAPVEWTRSLQKVQEVRQQRAQQQQQQQLLENAHGLAGAAKAAGDLTGGEGGGQ